MRSRPVIARMRWTASMVVSVPELQKRHRGSPQRSASVVAVIATLDLDDEVATGDRAHEMDGVHGRLGPRVAEAPQRKPPALGEHGRDRDRVLGRLREVGAPLHATRNRLDHRWVSMAHESDSCLLY